MKYSIILLPSTNHALRAEKVMINAGLQCKLMPVPRDIRSDCGLCLRIESRIKTDILHLLSEAKLDVEDCVEL